MSDLDKAAADLFGPQMKKQIERTDECLRHVVAQLIGHRFEIWEPGGKVVKACIKPFGDVVGGHAGLDIQFDDGGYLELQITRTGWGSPVNASMPIAASEPTPAKA